MESASALKKWYLYVNLLFEIKLSTGELMLLKCSVREYAWESLGQQGDPTSPFLKEISPEFSLEGLMLKLKLQYCGHMMQRTDSLEKALMLGKTEGRRRRGHQEDEMVGWHHWLNRCKSEQALRVHDGQGSLTCCSPWGSWRVRHNWATELN